MIKKINEFLNNRNLQLKSQFDIKSQILVNKFKYHSNLSLMLEDKNYIEIINMGKNIIPFLLEKLKTNDKLIYIFLLKELTNINPISENSKYNIELISNDWIKWGKENGY